MTSKLASFVGPHIANVVREDVSLGAEALRNTVWQRLAQAILTRYVCIIIAIRQINCDTLLRAI